MSSAQVSGGGIAVIAIVINSVTIESLVVWVMASRGDSWRTVTLSEPNDALKHITYGAIVIGIFFTVAGLLGCCGTLLPARSVLIAVSISACYFGAWPVFFNI